MRLAHQHLLEVNGEAVNERVATRLYKMLQPSGSTNSPTSGNAYSVEQAFVRLAPAEATPPSPRASILMDLSSGGRHSRLRCHPKSTPADLHMRNRPHADRLRRERRGL
jgi:hypothetical protein